MTSGTYPWSFVIQIFHNGRLEIFRNTFHLLQPTERHNIEIHMYDIFN